MTTGVSSGTTPTGTSNPTDIVRNATSAFWTSVFTLALGLGAVAADVTARDDDGDRDRERGAYQFGLSGDLPYSDLQAQVGVPNLIADMNRHDLAFTAHDGDLKAGSGTPGSVTPTRAPVRDPRTLVETDGQPDGFKDYLTALRDEVIAFRKPVAYVHGDSHYHRIDKPLLDTHGRRLENFTRVETFGDNQANGNNDANWLRLTIDPRTREVFSYQAQIVPANQRSRPCAPPSIDRPDFTGRRVVRENEPRAISLGYDLDHLIKS